MEKNRCLMGSLKVHGPKNSCPPFLWSFLFFFSVGQILELTWDVPASSGPGPSDPNCISYSYHSNVDFVKVKIPFIESQKEDTHNSLFSRKKNTYGLPCFHVINWLVGLFIARICTVASSGLWWYAGLVL